VLDGRDKLVGIITRGDITLALLRTLQGVFSEARRCKIGPAFFEALESERTI
jgi:hypothetical protein